GKGRIRIDQSPPSTRKGHNGGCIPLDLQHTYNEGEVNHIKKRSQHHKHV
ncbi:unnamed protein product, partial [Arabidopsis lyrata]